MKHKRNPYRKGSVLHEAWHLLHGGDIWLGGYSMRYAKRTARALVKAFPPKKKGRK